MSGATWALRSIREQTEIHALWEPTCQWRETDNRYNKGVTYIVLGDEHPGERKQIGLGGQGDLAEKVGFGQRVGGGQLSRWFPAGTDQTGPGNVRRI